MGDSYSLYFSLHLVLITAEVVLCRLFVPRCFVCVPITNSEQNTSFLKGTIVPLGERRIGTCKVANRNIEITSWKQRARGIFA